MTETDSTAQQPDSPSYYAHRGVEEASERHMRADYTQLFRIRDARSGAEDPVGSERLQASAEALECRWRDHDSPDVRSDWKNLCETAERWRVHPEEMAQLYVRTMGNLIDGSSSGVTETQWRSQRQARELTGNGAWLPMQDPLSTEAARLHPYDFLDPANPKYHGGRRAATWTEQVMRAAFARVHQLRKQRMRAGTDLGRQQITEQMYTVAEPWLARCDALGEQWRLMQALAAGTYASYHEFAEAAEQLMHESDTDGLFTRSLGQIRELKRIHPPSEADISRSPKALAPFGFAAARTAELRNTTPRRKL